MPKLGYGYALYPGSPSSLPSDISGLSLWLKADAGVITTPETFINQIILTGSGVSTSDGVYTRESGGTTTFYSPNGNYIGWQDPNWYLYDTDQGYESYYNVDINFQSDWVTYYGIGPAPQASYSSIPTGNVLVTKWNDQSGNNRDAFPDINFEPLIITNTLNGKPVIDFNNQKYLTSIFSAINFMSQTVFTVFKYSSSAEIYGRIFTQNNSSSINDYSLEGNYIPLIKNQGNDEISFFVVPEIWGDSIPVVNNQWYISITKHTGSSISLKLNNTINNSYDHNLNVSINRFRIGAADKTDGPPSNNDYFNSQIAEVIVYDKALTTEERKQVEGYLNAKYAIY